MPDWSYHSLFKPMLFCLPPRVARNVTLRAMSIMASIPGGTQIIRWLGHTASHACLQQEIGEVCYRSPVGLASSIDPLLIGTVSLSKLGFGFVEVGPISLQPISEGEIGRDQNKERLIFEQPLANPGLEKSQSTMQRHRSSLDVPVHIRLTHNPKINRSQAVLELQTLVSELESLADVLVIHSHYVLTEDEWTSFSKVTTKPVYLYVKDGQVINPLPVAVSGVVLREGNTLKQTVLKWREQYPTLPILAANGVHEPKDAWEFIKAGAQLVMVHDGFVFSGPGLPKRINEYVTFQRLPEESESREIGWIAFLLMAVGILLGGSLATLLALTVVVLPYDEAFLGMTRSDIESYSPYLLPFMSHDRISLAGVMLSTAIIYWQLAIHGIREKKHWAKVSYCVGAISGFSNLFLFVGFGYFDILHAVFYMLLLPFFLVGIFRSRKMVIGDKSSNCLNTPAWKKSLYGQFIFIILSMFLIVGGLVITYIGCTTVFVEEDLAYMGMSNAEIHAIDPQLVPLIAHDRTGFGSALVSNGLLLLLISLWGFKEGERWVWWTLALAGIPGFVYGLGVHIMVGYVDQLHLLPAYFLLLLYGMGLILTHSFLLTKRDATNGNL